jgi:hypothetical protein
MDTQSLSGIGLLLGAGFLLLPVQGALSVTGAALASAKNTAALAWSGVAGVGVFILASWLQQGGQLVGLMAALVLAYGAVLAVQCGCLAVRHGISWFAFLSDRRLYLPIAAVSGLFALLAGFFELFEAVRRQGLLMFALSLSALGGMILLASAEIRQSVFSRFAK